jgi:ornithine carbamoyltransferase
MPDGLLSLSEITPYQFSAFLDLVNEIKKKPTGYSRRLAHKIIGEVRGPETALPIDPSFHTATAGLGGSYIPCPLPSPPHDYLFTLMHLEKGMDCLVTGAFSHSCLNIWRNELSIPIINNGSDTFNPCRALADLFTLKEHNLDLNSLHFAYIGGRTPVLNSLIQALAKTGSALSIACPENDVPDSDIVNNAVREGNQTGFSLHIGQDPEEAAVNANVLYTDCGWQTNVSSKEAEKFRITPELLQFAGKEALVFHGHSLSAGKEIHYSVLSGGQSAALNQWENTLHVQKAIMVSLVNNKEIK